MTSVFTKYDVLLQSMTSFIAKYMTCYYKVRQVLLLGMTSARQLTFL